jgi:hypothetical protein
VGSLDPGPEDRCIRARTAAYGRRARPLPSHVRAEPRLPDPLLGNGVPLVVGFGGRWRLRSGEKPGPRLLVRR